MHIFFSKKFQHICVSLDVNFNETLTNDIVSFEQLGPGDHNARQDPSNTGVRQQTTHNTKTKVFLSKQFKTITVKLHDSNTDGSFTLYNLILFLSPYEILPIAPKKTPQIFKDFFLVYLFIYLFIYLNNV